MRVQPLAESPSGSDGARRLTRHATNAFEELSAARDVVLDKQKTTIWRESGARVGPYASTYSCPMWTSAWTSRLFARCVNELTGRRRANKMLKWCRPERRHILFSAAQLENCATRGRKTMTSHLLPTYARVHLAFERGEGVWLVATNGERYLDFTSGVAVNALGHAHPQMIAALTAQAQKALARLEPL